jgi:hypothetical protein
LSPIATAGATKKAWPSAGTSTAAKAKPKAAPKLQVQCAALQQNRPHRCAYGGCRFALALTTVLTTCPDKMRVAADLLELIEKAKA